MNAMSESEAIELARTLHTLCSKLTDVYLKNKNEFGATDLYTVNQIVDALLQLSADRRATLLSSVLSDSEIQTYKSICDQIKTDISMLDRKVHENAEQYKLPRAVLENLFCIARPILDSKPDSDEARELSLTLISLYISIGGILPRTDEYLLYPLVAVQDQDLDHVILARDFKIKIDALNNQPSNECADLYDSYGANIEPLKNVHKWSWAGYKNSYDKLYKFYYNRPNTDLRHLVELIGEDKLPFDFYHQVVDHVANSGGSLPHHMRFPAWILAADKPLPFEAPKLESKKSEKLRNVLSKILTKCRLLNGVKDAQEMYDTLRRHPVFKNSQYELPDILFDMHEDYCEALAWAFAGILADKDDNAVNMINEAVDTVLNRITEAHYSDDDRKTYETRHKEYNTTGHYKNDTVYGAQIPMSVRGPYHKYVAPLSYAQKRACAPNKIRHWNGRCITIGSNVYNSLLGKYGQVVDF